MPAQSMKRAVVVEPMRIEIEEVPVPVPAEGQVLIETGACGLCMTDVYRITGKDPMTQYPCDLIGHEPSGFIAAVGKNATRFRPGDRVTSLHALGGFTAFGEYFLQQEDRVFPLPEEIPFEIGTCEPLFAAARGVLNADILPGDLVAVVGVGFFGQLLAQGARFRGAYKVAALDKIDRRLDIALRHGADAGYNVDQDGVKRALDEITGGEGFDTVIECAGVQGAFDTCTELVRSGGTIFSYALHVKPETVNPQPWHWKGIRIQNNNWDHPWAFPGHRSVRLAEVGVGWVQRGFWRFDELTNGVVPLEDLRDAVEETVDHPERVMKYCVGKSRDAS